MNYNTWPVVHEIDILEYIIKILSSLGSVSL